jgi:H+-transporting ATPase
MTGLTSDEARRRLEKCGPNAVPDTAMHPLRRALTKFWAPVPWMLEAAIVLEVVLGKYVEAGIIAVLLAFNAVLGFFQEGRAQATLTALKSRLALNASVRRDGVWATVPAVSLVPGDRVKLSLGAVVAADVRLTEGQILLDQSMLTGESIPIEAGPGFETYAGALVRRGEAVAEVTATGARTKFGRTAELVRTAHVESSQQKAVLVARSFPWCSREFWRPSPWRCLPPSPLRRRSVRGPWRIWACSPPGSLPWMKRRASRCCARIKPAR